jgi:hypothetical protein
LRFLVDGQDLDDLYVKIEQGEDDGERQEETPAHEIQLESEKGYGNNGKY